MPTSHPAPMNVALDARVGAGFLADAFSEFISAANRLEDSYRELQKEVVQLRTELEDRNVALQSSLAENERMRIALQHILDSLPCGVVVLEKDRKIAMMNPEAAQLLELQSVRVQSLDDISARIAVDLRALCGNGDAEQEFSISSGGHKKWIAVRRRSSSAKRGVHSSQAILIFRDVTAQKQAEQEREAARNTVALAEMSTVLAHEIRNPLASLELFAGLIANNDGKCDEWISHLKAGIRSLSATVNNVLRFHSVGSPRVSRVDLAACLHNAIEFVRPIADQSGIELLFENHAPGIVIAADENALQQVTLNLACNAIRHMAAGGKLAVTLAQRVNGDQSTVVVEFSDTGSGISPEHIDKIFHAGFSGSGHTPGLGLAVCKRIVAQHGGTISVASRLNEGTTFFLEFPAL